MSVDIEKHIQRTVIDGVPTYWAEAPGPARAALIFRTGRADETLASSGTTHLIEHLALFTIDARRAQFGGFVDHLRTVFYASGSAEEAEGFLERVARALSALPVDRLDLEKRVLLTEAASAGSGSEQKLMSLRFGAAGFGLVDYQELGLRRVGADELRNWARERFTRDNAAIWLTGTAPPNLEFQLPDGPRSLPPEPSNVRGLELPAYAPGGGGVVAVSFLGRRSTALSAALSLLEERVHRRLRLERGLSYHASCSYLPLTGDVVHITVGADCLDEHAAVVRDEMLDELKRLANDGPESNELASSVADRTARLSQEPLFVLHELEAAATNDLCGAPVLTRAELSREYEQLDGVSIAEAVSGLLPSSLVLAPAGVTPPAGFSDYESATLPPVRGRRYKRRGRRVYNLPRRGSIVASKNGISFLRKAPDKTVTLAFNDVVAVLQLGPGRLTLIGTDGTWITIDTPTLVGGKRLIAEIERAIPADRFLPPEGEPGGTILDLAREKLGYRTTVWQHVSAVPEKLEPGERIVNLAKASRRFHHGLLVLTDRRLLYFSIGARAKRRHFAEFALDEVTSVGRLWLCTFLRRIVFKPNAGRKLVYTNVKPSDRAPEFIRALRLEIEARGAD